MSPRPITRSLDAHLKAVLLFSPLFPKQSTFTCTRSLITCSRNLSTGLFANQYYPFSVPKTFAISPSVLVQEDRNCGILSVRCFSSVPLINNVAWNEPVSCSEVGDGSHLSEMESDDVDIRPSIPVRAFFFSTSVDLKGLVDQNKLNFIPPTSRMTNNVVFKFGNLKTDSNAFLDAILSGSDCGYMVVFQNGSIMLFNVRDHEVDGYLKIVEKHASGLLPEMRKDDQILLGKMLNMPRSGNTSETNLN